MKLSRRHFHQLIAATATLPLAAGFAAESVVNATPDGYTLLLVGQPNAINATLYETLPFNFIRDIAPVAGIMTVPTCWWSIRRFPPTVSRN